MLDAQDENYQRARSPQEQPVTRAVGVYLNGPMTRQEVGTAAGVSPATVSNLVGELLEQGVLIEVGLEDSDGGRPRALLQVNPAYGYVIGVDVGETAFLVELFDLGMQVRASHVLDHRARPAGAPRTRSAQVLEGIEPVIAEQSGVSREQILGVGVGVPGLVEHGEDAVVHGQTVGWEAVPLGSCCEPGLATCRCSSTTAPRRWARRRSGSAPPATSTTR